MSDETPVFPTECPECARYLGGRLICQETLSPADLVELFAPHVRLKQARFWLSRGWLEESSIRLPGVRGRLVGTRDFIKQFDLHKRRPGRSGKRLVGGPARPLQTDCPHCRAGLGGYVARVELQTVSAIAAEVGNVSRETVHDWMRRGLIRGFRLNGIRAPLIEVNDFAADYAVLRRRHARRRDSRGST